MEVTNLTTGAYDDDDDDDDDNYHHQGCHNNGSYNEYHLTSY